MAKNDNLTDFLTDVANAIRNKKGTTALINPQDFSSEIASIESGGGSGTVEALVSKDVNFYDYDGTILYSYTTEEFQRLSSLPPLPTHQGLVCQGWNYTIEDIGDVQDVGGIYVTDDGSTKLYINIESTIYATVPLYFSQTQSEGIRIDWGDNTPIETIVGTGNITTSHTYNEKGNYCIKLNIIEGTGELGHNVSNKGILGSTSTAYPNMLHKIELGPNMGISNYAMYGCFSLKSITIPNGITEMGSYCFYNCRALRFISFPISITKINTCAFYYCYSMVNMSLPSKTNSVGTSTFRQCVSLNRIVIPKKLTSIQISLFNADSALSSIHLTSATQLLGQVFSGCKGLTNVLIPKTMTNIEDSFTNCTNVILYDFTQSTSIPNLSSTSCFTGINANCKIVVPDTLYDNWIAATNWSTYASYIIKKSDYEAL